MASTRTDRSLTGAVIAVARNVTGEIAADPAALTDVNYPPDQALNCAGFETIWVGVEIDGGSSPTATLEPLFYDPGAADGARWGRLLVGAAPGLTPLAAPVVQVTPALPSGQLVELRVDGWPKVFLRRTAVANATGTTGMRILARVGRPRPASGR